MTPAQPQPLHDVEGDFLGAQARAESGGAAQRLDALLDAKPAAAAAPSAPASTAAPPAAAAPARGEGAGVSAPASSSPAQKPLSPLGQSLGVMPEERDLPLGVVTLHRLEAGAQAYASQFTKDVGDAWTKLKTDLQAAVPDNAKMQSADFWTATKMDADAYLAAGKSIGDAFALALSPVTAAVDVATTATADWYKANYPNLVNAKELKDAIDRAIPGIAPARGLRGLPRPGERPPGAGGSGGAPPPRKVYHGTKATAEEVPHIGALSLTNDLGPHVTTDPGAAHVFSEEGHGMTGDSSMPGRVLEGTISPKKALDLPDLGGWLPNNVAAAIDDLGLTASKASGDNLGELSQKVLEAQENAGLANPTEAGNAVVKDWLKSKGYDAIKYRNVFEGHPADTYIVLDNSILKSVPNVVPGADAAPKRDWMFAGQAPDAKGRIPVTDADRKKAADYLNGKTPDNPVQASLETLSDEEGARQAITDIAKFIPEGAVKHDDVLQMGAYSMQRTPQEIAAGMKMLPTDEEMLSWKMMMDAGGAEVKRHADAYRADPSPENLENFTRAFTAMTKVVASWDEVGTGMGRAFRARQLAMQDTGAFAQQIRDLIAHIGPNNIAEAAEKLGSLKDPAKVAPFLQWLRRMKGRDALVYGWSNLLLSNVPKTLSKKLFGDLFSAALELSTTGLSETAGASPGGSTKNLLFGYLGGFKDAIRMAGRGLKEGRGQFYPEYQSADGVSKSRLDELGQGFDASTPGKAAMSLLRMAMPTRWIGAADDFAKLWHYKAKLHELVSAEAKGDSVRYGELMDNVPQALHEQAVAFALKGSYQEPLFGAFENARKLADDLNVPVNGTGVEVPIGRGIAPFIKVPSNLARTAYRVSPLPLGFASKAIRADMAAGGARRAKMMAAVGIGTAFSSVVAPMIVSDNITGGGPTDPGLRRFWLKTHQPYSIRIGDTWYGYQGAHPLGLMLGPIADTVDTFRYAKGQDAEELAVSLAFGVGHALLQPTFMTGASDFLDALNDPQGDGRYFFENLTASAAMPQGAAGIDNALDPWRRAHYGAIDAIQARTPGLSNRLPPVVDIWGDPIPRTAGWLPGASGGALARAISPVPMQKVGGSAEKVDGIEPAHAQPIDKWIWDHHEAFARDEETRTRILSPPGQAFSFTPRGSQIGAHVQLDGEQLHRLRVLAGNGAKLNGLGAKDAFNALIAGNYPNNKVQDDWNKGTDEAKALMIQKMWGTYRRAASATLVAEDKGLQDKIRAQIGQRHDVLSGTEGSGDGRPAAVAQPRF